MNAKLSHFSELSYFLSEKSTVCNDFLSLLDRFRLGQSLRKLKMEKEKGASALDLLKYLGSTDFVRGLPTQKLLAKYRRATVHYSK